MAKGVEVCGQQGFHQVGVKVEVSADLASVICEPLRRSRAVGLATIGCAVALAQTLSLSRIALLRIAQTRSLSRRLSHDFLHSLVGRFVRIQGPPALPYTGGGVNQLFRDIVGSAHSCGSLLNVQGAGLSQCHPAGTLSPPAGGARRGPRGEVRAGPCSRPAGGSAARSGLRVGSRGSAAVPAATRGRATGRGPRPPRWNPRLNQN